MSRAVLVGMLMCVLALAGCTALAQLTTLQSELASAGYSGTDINHNTTNGYSTLSIEATMPASTPTDEDADRIAEIVWTTYPVELDELVVVINGQVLMTASAGELTDRFGVRPVSSREDGGGSGVVIIVVTLVVAVLLAGLVVLVWWRGRRPPPPVAPPGNPPMPNPYQYPPQFPAAGP
jgi:hypothetical protein